MKITDNNKNIDWRRFNSLCKDLNHLPDKDITQSFLRDFFAMYEEVC